MSKFLADKVYKMTDEDGNCIVCFVSSGWDKGAAKLSVEESKNLSKLSIEVKAFKSNRTLKQNAMLWALLTKMSTAMSGVYRKTTVEECYALMLEETNCEYTHILAEPEAEKGLKEAFRVVRKIGERATGDRTMNLYQCFLGSSKYDKAEMSELIEATLDRLAELGVYDSEVECIRNEMHYKPR